MTVQYCFNFPSGNTAVPCQYKEQNAPAAALALWFNSLNFHQQPIHVLYPKYHIHGRLRIKIPTIAVKWTEALLQVTFTVSSAWGGCISRLTCEKKRKITISNIFWVHCYNLHTLYVHHKLRHLLYKRLWKLHHKVPLLKYELNL